MRICFISIFLSFLSFSSAAVSIDEFKLTAEESALVETGEAVYRFYSPDEAPGFIPALKPDRAYSLGLECLSVLDRPEGLNDLDLFNALLKVEGMKGIEYYSSTSKRVKILFEESHRIDENTKTRLPQITVNRIPETLSMSIMQDDATFGKVYSTLEYSTDEKGFYVQMENNSPLRVLLFKVAETKDMRITFSVYPVEDKLLLYAHCNVFTKDPLGLIDLNKNSFLHRVQALFTWLKAEIE